MTDDRTVVDQALDLLVYAPLGLALEAKDLLPKLAERGRGQVALARLVGRFAADRGQREARRIFGDDQRTDSVCTEPRTAAELIVAPFDGYDDLNAREVIDRLPDMTPDQLEGIEDYEQSHRARATILGRISQLRGW